MDLGIVFARAPQPAAAKTRLVPALGVEGAHRLYTAMFADTLALAERSSAVRLLSVAGELASREAAGWPVVRQPDATFGERLAWTFAQAFARGASRCVLIGADAPQMPVERLDAAFAGLRTHDVVIGPTHDGGYYLLGLRVPSPWIFEGIAWSTASVFDETLGLMRRRGCGSLVLPEEFDVDTPDEARRLHGLLAHAPWRAPRTAAALAGLFAGATA